MDVAEVAVFGTIAVSVMCWAAAEALRSRALWAAGALLMLVHAIAAFGVFYDWNHSVAQELTSQQTAALTGIEFAGGIYVNYVFVAAWILDAAWWLFASDSYESRPPWLAFAVRGFIFFIMLNGAVVFADGWARLIGSLAVAVVVYSWLLTFSSRRGAFTTAG
jgi:hypothetical protein